MRKMFIVVIAIMFISLSIPTFAEEGSEKMCPMMGKGKGMMMHKGKMMSMMKEMQGMMMDMMAMMKERKDVEDDKAMMKKLDDMMARCKEMMEETDGMMSEYMKKDMMGESEAEGHSRMPSGHESHH